MAKKSKYMKLSMFMIIMMVISQIIGQSFGPTLALNHLSVISKLLGFLLKILHFCKCVYIIKS